MSIYAWRRDIESVDDCESDEVYDARRAAGRKIALENGPELYGFESWDDDKLDEIETEEAADIIGFYRIKKDSALHVLLERFLARQGKEIEGTVRDVVFYGDCWNDAEYMYFVTGCGYSVFDRDLLGGNGDGLTEAAFDKYVDEVFKAA